jgi:hypothetical protein
MSDFVALLEKAGLSKSDADLVLKKFTGFGYSLTKNYEGSGDHLLQSDDALDFLIRRLMIPHTPLKRMGHGVAHDVFRSLSQDCWRIVLPTTFPVVP